MMTGMKKIAVILSVYKNDKTEYLKLALESILNQTCRDFNLLLGIDGPISKDLRSFINNVRDERLHIIENKENRGLASTLNDMLVECQKGEYEYIARMDSDDIAVSDRFERQIKFLQEHSDIDVVGGAINEIDGDGHDRGKIIRYPCSAEDSRQFFAKRNPVAHPAVMFRRSFFDKAGWHYPTDFIRNEDTRLWHEGYKHGCKIANIPDVVLNFRMTDDMFKHRRNGKTFAKSQLALRKMIAKDLNYGPMAYIYAYAMYLLMLSPSWMLKWAYKFLR